MKCQICEINNQIHYLTEETIQEAIEAHKGAIHQWCYILHDKDTNEDGSIKTPHWHIYLRFYTPQDSKYICKWFGQTENRVEQIKGKRYSAGVAYATHANAPEKYQYDVGEVKANFDVAAIISKEAEAKALGTSKKQSELRKLEIINKIDSGEIKPYNIHEHVSAVEYNKYKRDIDNTFKYRTEKLKSEVNREMKAIYVQGESGCGKTTWAKQYAEKQGMRVFVSSGSNDVLDGYRGEECIVLDDLRPSCMGLSDLLKMLDNNTASTVRSRYYNKVLECKLIIITSVLQLDEFFKNVFESESEPITQLKRRCGVYVQMDKSIIKVSFYNNYEKDYTNTQIIPNTILHNIKLDRMTEDKAKQITLEMFGPVTEPDFEPVSEQIKLPWE